MTTSFPLYRFTDDSTRVENITDWGLEQFRKKYSRRDLINQIPQQDVINHVPTKTIAHKVIPSKEGILIWME